MLSADSTRRGSHAAAQDVYQPVLTQNMICMKYRIIILIIIIISLDQILLTHHTHTRAHTSPFRLSLFDGSLAPSRDAVDASFRRVSGNQSWPVAGSFKYKYMVSTSFWMFFACKKTEKLGRTEKRTRDR